MGDNIPEIERAGPTNMRIKASLVTLRNVTIK